MTGIDPWFLDQMQQIVDLEKRIVTEKGSVTTLGAAAPPRPAESGSAAAPRPPAGS